MPVGIKLWSMGCSSAQTIEKYDNFISMRGQGSAARQGSGLRVQLCELDPGAKLDLVQDLAQPGIDDLAAVLLDKAIQGFEPVARDRAGEQADSNLFQLVEHVLGALLRASTRTIGRIANAERGIDRGGNAGRARRFRPVETLKQLRELAGLRL